jgi:hypothetical protein
MLMQATIRGSAAHYWISAAGTGVWRKARKPQVCRNGKSAMSSMRAISISIPESEHQMAYGQRSSAARLAQTLQPVSSLKVHNLQRE